MTASASDAHNNRDPSTNLNISETSRTDANIQSSDCRDEPPLASPRKRRRRMRFLMDIDVDQLTQNRPTPALQRSPSSDSDSVASEMSDSEADEFIYDQNARMNTLDDVERMVYSPDAPSVAMLYQSNSTQLPSSQFQCTPLACFYPQHEPTGLDPTCKRFDLNLAKTTSSKKRRQRRRDNFDREQMGRSRNEHSAIFHEQLDTPTLPSKQAPIDPQRIPVEVFELIAQHLSLTDVKNMRLVDKAFERGVSGHLFGNVVVPFHVDVYGALAAGMSEPSHHIDYKGKGKAQASDSLSTEHSRAQAALKQQKKRLDVFRGFGPHIRRFGFNFTVNEREMTVALPKEVHQGHQVYWGDFRWPFPEYPRFEDRAGLENTADETSTMRTALQHLKQVKHLALSIDSGLGWLPGTDLSIRSQILGPPPHPFAMFKQAVEPGLEQRRKLWTILENAYEAAHDKTALKMAGLVRYENAESAQALQRVHRGPSATLEGSVLQSATKDALNVVARLRRTHQNLDHVLREAEPRLPSSIATSISNLTQTPPATRRNFNLALFKWGRRQARDPFEPAPAQKERNPVCDDQKADSAQRETWQPHGSGIPPPDEDHGNPRCGILYTRHMQPTVEGTKKKVDALVPNNLTQTQREWLMETAWAQDAFLSSYMIAVTDNKEALGSVKTLTLSPFSSGHLTKLLRPEFWSSLPSLTDVELIVLPDWRQIERQPAGYTSAPAILPTKALDSLYYVIDSVIAPRKNIQRITLGWASGGEHAEGMHARNHLLMPAPITERHATLPTGDFGLAVLLLPHVRHLKLINCWIAPNVLQDWVRRHLSHKLTSLELESVSLTAHPKHPVNGGAGAGPGGQGAAAMAAALAVAAAGQGQGAIAAAAVAAAGGGAGFQAGGNMFNQIMQQHQQQFQQAPNPLPGGVPQLLTVAQMQNHLQQMTQNAMNANLANVANPVPVNGMPVPALPGPNAGVQIPQQQNQQAQPVRPRDGSWPTVLSGIQNWSTLSQKCFTVTFASCGYALLPRNSFDQSEIELAMLTLAHIDHMQQRQTQAWFHQRRSTVGETLLPNNDGMLARVSSSLPVSDVSPLEDVWHLSQGWPGPDMLGSDYNDEEGWGKWGHRTQEAAEYDGKRPGGSGRFSGKVAFAPWQQNDD